MHPCVNHFDVRQHRSVATRCHRVTLRHGVGVAQQRGGDVPPAPVVVPFAAKAVIRPKPSRRQLVVEDILDPMLYLCVDVHLYIAEVSARIQLRHQRDHSVEPIWTAFVPRSRVVCRSTDPDRVVHVRPKEIQVTAEAVGKNNELISQPSLRGNGPQLERAPLEWQEAFGGCRRARRDGAAPWLLNQSLRCHTPVQGTRWG
mmetsp:Transcript_23779/g.62177  ORF Transcript_23779/g.62177 Transcript_23779/m.62177 type:complete len:201 (+) Transcript_23779:2135-2737(+)